jgi:soluble lytic murein transglycosylase-like protein
MLAMSVFAILATPATIVQAQGLNLSGNSTRSQRDVMRNQMRLLDGRLSEQYSASDRFLPPSARSRGAIPAYTGIYRGEYLNIARAAAQRHDIPEDLFFRLVTQESGWNAAVVSEAGAIGLAQLMPDTASLLRVDPTDPVQNLEGGARYLRQMYNRFGSWRLALAAYNAGPAAVARHGGVPPYDETTHYVAVILGAG